MKRILKGPEPETLTRFRAASPDATWEEMRNDALHGGQEALKDCRARTLADQRGLCAYCECRLETGAGQVVVEHIHPKSDASTSHNWHLDWRNMVANCRGGENEGSLETPLPDNLSCTASKKDAPLALNPLELPAFPNLFDFDKECVKPRRFRVGKESANPLAFSLAFAYRERNPLHKTRKPDSSFLP